MKSRLASCRCIIDELSKSNAIEAAELSAGHKLSIADAIIYATALDGGADLLICDAHFKGPALRRLSRQGGELSKKSCLKASASGTTAQPY